MEVTHRQYLGESERARGREGGIEISGGDGERKRVAMTGGGGGTDRQTNRPKLKENFTHTTRAKSTKIHLLDFTHSNRQTGYPMNEN